MLAEPRLHAMPRPIHTPPFYTLTQAPSTKIARRPQVWLDDLHLSLARDPRRPPPPGTRRLGGPSPTAVLELRNVCWLDIGGTIRGVLPGDYQLVFCVDLARHHMFPGDELTLVARVVGPQPSARSGGGAASGSSSGGGARREPGPEAEVRVGARELKAAQVEAGRAGRLWTWLRGGVIRVAGCGSGGESEVSTVKVACHSHSDTWKYGMRWAFAQLLPVPEGAAAAALPRLSARAAGGASQGDAVYALGPEPVDDAGSEWETDDEDGDGAAGPRRAGWCSQQ
jgi:hypothetical protein